MGTVELLGNIIKIGHGGDIKPAFRHRNDDIGGAETQTKRNRHIFIIWRDGFAEQVLAGDAGVDLAVAQIVGDFRRREEGDTHAGQTLQRAAIATVGTAALDRDAGLLKKRRGGLHQPALRRNAKNKLRHGSTAFTRSVWMAQPTAGMDLAAPRSCSNPS